LGGLADLKFFDFPPQHLLACDDELIFTMGNVTGNG
jgi:hypothetical protein